MENTVTISLDEYKRLSRTDELMTSDNVLYICYGRGNVEKVYSFKKFNTEKLKQQKEVIKKHEERISKQNYKIIELEKELKKEKRKKKSCILF